MSRPQWAEAITRRREELGLTQLELAVRANLSESLVRKVEAGIHSPKSMRTKNLEALLLALGWDSATARQNGIELPGHRGEALDVGALVEDVERFVWLPVVGESGELTGRRYPVERHLAAARPGSFVYRLADDCMASLAADRNVPRGSYVLLEPLDDPAAIQSEERYLVLHYGAAKFGVVRQFGAQWGLFFESCPGFPLDFGPGKDRLLGHCYGHVISGVTEPGRAEAAHAEPTPNPAPNPIRSR